MEDKGVQEEGRGDSSWANSLGFPLLYPHPRVPAPSFPKGKAIY